MSNNENKLTDVKTAAHALNVEPKLFSVFLAEATKNHSPGS